MSWLRIDSDPPVAIWRDRAALAHIDCDLALPALISLGVLRRVLSRPNFATAQTANMSVSIDNGSGAMTDLFRSPPLRQPAHVMDGSVEVFSGLVTAVDVGKSGQLSIESGFTRPISDTVPLRSTVAWGSFDNVQALPVGYGRVTVQPIQYSADRRLWMLLDHPIQGVDQVMRDNIPTGAYAWSNTLDKTGRAVAILELANPLGDREVLSVALRGKMHPNTGELLVRPDEVIWDFLAHVCGYSITQADLDGFRGETDGIEIGGVLSDSTRTIRAQIDIILGSVGAAWSAGIPGFAISWPPMDGGDVATSFDQISATEVRSTVQQSDLYNVVRVLYDYDWAAKKHRQALQLTAPDVVSATGGIDLEIDAGWLHSSRLADALGRKHLEWSARPNWLVSWRADWDAGLVPGAWIEITHPNSPVSGRQRLIQADLDMDHGYVQLAIVTPVGEVPRIVATALSTTY